jgi:hypothetical protein
MSTAIRRICQEHGIPLARSVTIHLRDGDFYARINCNRFEQSFCKLMFLGVL